MHPTAIGELIGTKISSLPGVDNRKVLFDAYNKFTSNEISEGEFIAIHYEWIFDNVLSSFSRISVPEKTEVLRSLEMKIKSLPKSHKDDPNGEERSMIGAWMEFLDKTSKVNLENESNLRWLRAIERYFRAKGATEKAEVVLQMVLGHKRVSWGEI